MKDKFSEMCDQEKQDQRDVMRQVLNRCLAVCARRLPCACMPYRGGTTKAYHWDTCPWSGFLDGFHAAAEAMGVDPDSLWTFELEPLQVRGSGSGQD